MSRFFLIAIFSCLCAGSAFAQANWNASFFAVDQSTTSGLAFASGYYVSPGSGQVAWSHQGRFPLDFPTSGDGIYSIFFNPEGFSANIYGTTYENRSWSVSGGVATEIGFVPWESHPSNPGPTPTPTPSPTPWYTDSVDYDVTFGPEYDGMKVSIVDQDGNVISEHVIGPDGLTVAGSYDVEKGEPVTAELRVEIERPGPADQEGVPTWVGAGGYGLGADGAGVAGVSTWSETGPVMQTGATFQRDGNTWTSLGNGNFEVTGSYFRPSYANISIPDQYGGGQWSLVNASGGLVASGQIPSGGGPVSWSGLVTGGDGQLNFVVQPIVSGDDGVPSFGSPVNLGSGSGPVSSAPSGSAPSVPSVPSVPPIVPLPSPSPVSSPTSTNNYGTTAPGADLANDETATVEEDTTDYMDTDDGEDEILETAAGISETWGEIFEKLYEAQGILDGIGAKWSAAASTAPEQISMQCTFAFGPASVDLSPFTRYRPATAAFGWFMAALALYTMTNAALRK